MPYNGSGTFTLAEAAFVPNTVISSTVMNSDLSDLATNGLTNAVTKDGQTTITGAFKGFSGSVGLPMYSFSADTDSGIYRIAANNIGISVNATKILDIGIAGMSVVGTLASTGAYSPSGAILAADGTVLLPEYSFTADPDTGVYRIGANNIGVAVNAAKVLDISTAGLNVIGTVASNGAVFTPTAQAAGMVNGTIVESHSGNAVTFAVKTLAGADPSATDIVYFVFRNVTPGTGNYVVLQVTAALSLTVSSGSVLGTVSSNVAFRLWLVAFNDASTVRLGIINCVLGGATPTSVYPLAQFPIATSTAEGGAGGADSAQTFYTGTAVTSKAYTILGYASYETGVTTAGSWAAAPTRIELARLGMPMPGQVVQGPVTNSTTTVGSTTSATFAALTNGQTQPIIPTSAANLIRVFAQGSIGIPISASAFLQLQRGSTLIGNPTTFAPNSAGGTNPASLLVLDFPNATSSQTYGFQGKVSSGTTLSYPVTATGAILELTEIMT